MDEVNSKTNERIRVVIVDDDVEIRTGLQYIIDDTDRFVCVGAYKKCAEVLSKLEDTVPDIVLMDIGLPDRSGIDCIRGLKRDFPDIQVIMLTVYSDDEKIFESLRAGAVGYLLKKTKADKILSAIEEAYRGGVPMTGEIARRMLGYFQKKEYEPIDSQLSSREEEVLEALIEGLSYKSISKRLFISVHTVRFHLHNIYAKLHVNSRAEAVAKSLREKL